MWWFQDLDKIASYFETLCGDFKTLVRLQFTLKPYVDWWFQDLGKIAIYLETLWWSFMTKFRNDKTGHDMHALHEGIKY